MIYLKPKLLYYEPMHRLLLIRHAKSSWKYPDLQDHDRPLNKRGERDRWAMAEFLKDKGELPDQLVTSSAQRALKLAEAIGQTIDVPVVENSALYTFSAKALYSCLCELPDELNHIAVVSHNPAITQVANDLLESDLCDDYFDNVPTSGIVALQCNINRWRDLSYQNVDLDYFVAPKLITK